MNYETVLTKVRTAPEVCLDEISKYIDYVLYRYEEQEKEKKKGNLSEFFGVLQIDGDPLEIQKEMRNEWN